MSKFGAHITNGGRRGFGAALQKCADDSSPVPFLYALDQNVWHDVQQYSPQTILVFRTQPRIDGGGWDNPPAMYVDDPGLTANYWYSLCKPIWLLNQAHYYAPSNERNPLPSQDAWIDAFDLRMMQLADADGLKLALHGDSQGTPDYPQWQNYRTSLAYAAQHGHIITLHEPIRGIDLALRYRKVHEIIEPFAPGLRLAISECYGDLTGDPVHYVDSFAGYDVEAMRDNYLIGFAGYQIGGDESFAAEIPQWADYVASHPTPDEPPIDERVFDFWADEDTGAVYYDNPHSVEMDRNVRLVAHTKKKVEPPQTYTLTLSTDGFGSVIGAGIYQAGALAMAGWKP